MTINQVTLLQEYTEISSRVSNNFLNLGTADFGRLKRTIDYLVENGYLLDLKIDNCHMYRTTESFPYFMEHFADMSGEEIPKIAKLEQKIPHLRSLMVEGYIGKSICSNPEFLDWKEEVLYELRKMKQDDLIQDLQDLLTSFNGLNDELTLNEVAAKLKILVNNIGEYLKRDEKVEENIMDNKKVFVVHGHDHQLLQEVELMIRRIGLEPIILKNEANAGRTIIEKIEYFSNVGFGIVLYTACDEGRKKGTDTLHNRARQNVIFEHGYLYAKLGRGHVAALNDSDIELPSDLDGVLYIAHSAQDWKNQLMREMKDAGLKFDATKV